MVSNKTAKLGHKTTGMIVALSIAVRIVRAAALFYLRCSSEESNGTSLTSEDNQPYLYQYGLIEYTVALPTVTCWGEDDLKLSSKVYLAPSSQESYTDADQIGSKWGVQLKSNSLLFTEGRTAQGTYTVYKRLYSCQVTSSTSCRNHSDYKDDSLYWWTVTVKSPCIQQFMKLVIHQDTLEPNTADLQMPFTLSIAESATSQYILYKTTTNNESGLKVIDVTFNEGEGPCPSPYTREVTAVKTLDQPVYPSRDHVERDVTFSTSGASLKITGGFDIPDIANGDKAIMLRIDLRYSYGSIVSQEIKKHAKLFTGCEDTAQLQWKHSGSMLSDQQTSPTITVAVYKQLVPSMRLEYPLTVKTLDVGLCYEEYWAGAYWGNSFDQPLEVSTDASTDLQVYEVPLYSNIDGSFNDLSLTLEYFHFILDTNNGVKKTQIVVIQQRDLCDDQNIVMSLSETERTITLQTLQGATSEDFPIPEDINYQDTTDTLDGISAFVSGWDEISVAGKSQVRYSKEVQFLKDVCSDGLKAYDSEDNLENLSIDDELTHTCPEWTEDLAETTVSTELKIKNEKYPVTLQATYTKHCVYDPCLNSVAFDQQKALAEEALGAAEAAEVAPEPGSFSDLYLGPVIDTTEVVNVSIDAAPTEVQIPLMYIFCRDDEHEISIPSGSLHSPDGSTSTPLTEDQLASYGVTVSLKVTEVEEEAPSIAQDGEPVITIVTEGFLTFQSKDFTLGGHTIEVDIRVGVEREPEWFRETKHSLVVAPTGCIVTQDYLDEAVDSLGTLAFIVVGQGQTSKLDVSHLKDFFTTLIEAQPLWQLLCEEFVYNLETDADFVIFDGSGLMTFSPTLETPPGYYAADIIVSFSSPPIYNDPPTFTLQVTVQVEGCVVSAFTFQPTTLTLDYSLGDEALIEALPGLEQTPDCQLDVTSYEFLTVTSEVDVPLGFITLAQPEIAVGVTVDEDQPSAIKVLSRDLSLMGKIVSAEIIAVALQKDNTRLESKPLKVLINVKEQKIDITGGVPVPPLTCSTGDLGWQFKLPTSLGGTDDFEIELESREETSGLFVFNEDEQLIELGPDAKKAIVQGDFCSKFGSEIELFYEITSSVLGSFSQGMSVKISPLVEEEEQTVKESGYKVELKDEEPLLVKALSMTQDGKLTIAFSRNITAPLLYNSEPTDQIAKRRLEGGSDQDPYLVNIADVVSLGIKDGDLDDSLDKRIDGVTLEQVNGTTLQIGVIFAAPTNITTELLEPDVLEVKFNLPELILDASSRQPFQGDNLSWEVPLQPQMTTEELVKLQELASQVASAGASLAIWQIIMCFALGKTINSMWFLVNTLQFFVYISMWQVRHPNLVRLLLKELKRIALGEFMDDLDLAGKLKNAVGLPTTIQVSEAEPVGRERLGSDDMAVSIGPTILLVACLILLCVLVIVLLYRSSLKCSQESKWRSCLAKAKAKLFYNPLIRFLMLNALKLNITALVTVSTVGWHVERIVPAAAMLLMVNALGLVLGCCVRRKREELHMKEVKASIGTLYLGLRPEKAHQYAPVFMLRRALFAVITVQLFSYPSFQMLAHIVLTLLNIVFLSQKGLMQTRRRYVVEAGSEFLGLIATIWLMQSLVITDQRGKDIAEKGFFGTIGLILLLNLANMIASIVENCQVKRNIKKLMKKREEVYREAVKEAKKEREELEKARQMQQKAILERQMAPNPYESILRGQDSTGVDEQVSQVKTPEDQKEGEAEVRQSIESYVSSVVMGGKVDALIAARKALYGEEERPETYESSVYSEEPPRNLDLEQEKPIGQLFMGSRPQGSLGQVRPRLIQPPITKERLQSRFANIASEANQQANDVIEEAQREIDEAERIFNRKMAALDAAERKQ